MLWKRFSVALEQPALFDEAREDARAYAAELARGGEDALGAGVGEERHRVRSAEVSMAMSSLLVTVLVSVSVLSVRLLGFGFERPEGL